jgi:hypothetical protein
VVAESGDELSEDNYEEEEEQLEAEERFEAQYNFRFQVFADPRHHLLSPYSTVSASRYLFMALQMFAQYKFCFYVSVGAPGAYSCSTSLSMWFLMALARVSAVQSWLPKNLVQVIRGQCFYSTILTSK